MVGRSEAAVAVHASPLRAVYLSLERDKHLMVKTLNEEDSRPRRVWDLFGRCLEEPFKIIQVSQGDAVDGHLLVSSMKDVALPAPSLKMLRPFTPTANLRKIKYTVPT